MVLRVFKNTTTMKKNTKDLWWQKVASDRNPISTSSIIFLKGGGNLLDQISELQRVFPEVIQGWMNRLRHCRQSYVFALFLQIGMLLKMASGCSSPTYPLTAKYPTRKRAVDQYSCLAKYPQNASNGLK